MTSAGGAMEESNRPAITSSLSAGHGPPRPGKCGRTAGKECEWKHPRPPSVKHLWKDKATEAVLRDTVDYIVNVRKRSREEAEEGGRVRSTRRMGRAHLRLCFPLSLSFVSFLCQLFLVPLSGG